MLKIITGLLTPITGNIQWNQQDILQQRSDYVKEITYIGHKAAIKTELSVIENIKTLLGFSGQSQDQQAIEWGRLQLQNTTLATHSNVESRARKDLKMQLPENVELVRLK